MPSKHLSIVRHEGAVLLFAILKGYKINMGKLIKNSILSYQSSNLWGHLSHPAIITYMCIQGGVTLYRDEEERCHKTPPLTLTTITNPPANKGKGKLEEAEEERREKGTECDGIGLNEQALVLSIENRNNARQGSTSPDWMIEGEKPESSRQHSHNSNLEFMEMLRKMDQRMLERDNQLRTQLKMRDQFFKFEIRKRDLFMDEEIK